MTGKPPSWPPNVVSLAGPSGSGKTALICWLIKWFTARGLKVAVLKHSHQTEVAESEVARLYRRAGVRAVAQASPTLLQVTRYLEAEPEPAEVLPVLAAQADLVLVEGYKHSPLPKIVLADARADPISVNTSRVIAWVSRSPLDADQPVFRPGQVEDLGRFILDYVAHAAKKS